MRHVTFLSALVPVMYVAGIAVAGGGTYTSSPNAAIPDNSPVGVNDTISVVESFTVGDVNIELSIDHTFVGDFCITLQHGGTTVDLIQRPGTPGGCHIGGPFGCGQDNYNGIILDDEAGGGPIEAQCAPDLSSPPNYTPNFPLSAFNGLDATGDWTLTVIDNAGGDLGTLLSWSLHLTAGEPKIALGACCICDGPTITCQVATEEDCNLLGGEYLGDGSICSSGVTYTSSPNAPFPDNSPVGVNDTISVVESFTVSDVNVELSIDHTFVGDLCITLQHGGTTVDLIQRPGTAGGCHLGGPFGCGQDNYNGIILDDEAGGGPIEAQCAPDLSSPPNYTPNFPLSAFNGLDATGDWTLTVSDNAGGDLGTFVSWSLNLTVAGAARHCEGVIMCDVGDQGCSLGFWKNHTDAWTGYSPDALFSSEFANAFEGMTLHEVISQPSGPPTPTNPPQLNSLGKQAVAALLNATSLNFGMTPAQVIAAFNDAYGNWLGDGDVSHLTALKSTFDQMNNQGCPAFAMGDISMNSNIGVQDLLIVVNQWNSLKSSADIDEDGAVGVTDLLYVINHWGPAPAQWRPHQ